MSVSTDFVAWASGLDQVVTPSPWRASHRAHRPGGVALVALTGAGPVLVAAGNGLDDLRRHPPDRLALVPSTFGGMIVTSDRFGAVRAVCADLDGGVALLERGASVTPPPPGGPAGQAVATGDPAVATGDPAVATGEGCAPGWEQRRLLTGRGEDHEGLALLWLLMDVRATRPALAELALRVLVWAWLGHPRRDPTAPGPDAGLACVGAGDLSGLAALVGATLPASHDAVAVRNLATGLGHPALRWDRLPWVVSEDQRLDFLHACLPTRWALADELAVGEGRADLAGILMAAPTPAAWWPRSG